MKWFFQKADELIVYNTTQKIIFKYNSTLNMWKSEEDGQKFSF